MNDAVLWLTVALLSAVMLTDVKRVEMPSAISSAMLMLAAARAGMSGSATAWLSAAGLFVACGCVVACGEAVGSGTGDAAALAALGALVRIAKVVPMLFCVAIAGGRVAIAALLRGESDSAYPPTVSAGLLPFVITTGAPQASTIRLLIVSPMISHPSKVGPLGRFGGQGS